MNQREKVLLFGILGLLALVLLFAGAKKTADLFKARTAKVNQLKRDLREAEAQIKTGQEASRLIAEKEMLSLPPDIERARGMYKSWLFEWADRWELEDTSINAQGGRERRGYYYLHPFTVQGETDLRRLTRMLHEFYATRQLHRIRQLTITPQDRKRLKVFMTVDALSLPEAPDRTEIARDENALVDGRPLADFEGPILERNLFGPKNNPPRLRISRSYRVERGADFELEVEAEDRDQDDQLQYEADVEGLAGARFRQGELTWRPGELGEYQASFEVVDDGIPARTDRIDVTFTVVEPQEAPPPRAPTPFNWAAHTQLNAIIFKSGEPTAWLNVRPAGKTLKIKEGEEFEVGRLRYVMKEIGLRQAKFESDGRLFSLDLRDFLSEAQEIGPSE